MRVPVLLAELAAVVTSLGAMAKLTIWGLHARRRRDRERETKRRATP